MISVPIWRKTLVRNDACKEGLALFDAIAAQQPETDARRLERIRIARWTPLHQIWGWVASAPFAQWMEHKGLIPRADLSRADLSGADLSGADLSRAYRGSSSPIPGWRTLVTGYIGRAT